MSHLGILMSVSVVTSVFIACSNKSDEDIVPKTQSTQYIDLSDTPGVLLSSTETLYPFERLVESPPLSGPGHAEVDRVRWRGNGDFLLEYQWIPSSWVQDVISGLSEGEPHPVASILAIFSDTLLVDQDSWFGPKICEVLARRWLTDDDEATLYSREICFIDGEVNIADVKKLANAQKWVSWDRLTELTFSDSVSDISIAREDMSAVVIAESPEGTKAVYIGQLDDTWRKLSIPQDDLASLQDVDDSDQNTPVSVSWSVDGRYIAVLFTSTDYFSRFAGSTLHRQSAAVIIDTKDWSIRRVLYGLLDGETILWSDINQDLAILSSNGDQSSIQILRSVLDDDPPLIFELVGIESATDFDWSPTSASLVVIGDDSRPSSSDILKIYNLPSSSNVETVSS